MTQPGLFDIEFRLDDLSKIGDPLLFLNETIKWDDFDDILRMARAKDRLSFMLFLSLKMENTIPDRKSIWHYRERFTNTNTMDKLFRKFKRMLEQKGFSAKKGTLIDTTIVNTPIQRNKRDENEIIKNGTPT